MGAKEVESNKNQEELKKSSPQPISVVRPTVTGM